MGRKPSRYIGMRILVTVLGDEFPFWVTIKSVVKELEEWVYVGIGDDGTEHHIPKDDFGRREMPKSKKMRTPRPPGTPRKKNHLKVIK